MDLTGLVAMGSGLLFGIGAVSAAIVKVGPKVLKYVHVASHAIKFVDDLVTKMEPDASKGETKPTLTADEVQALWQDLQDLQAAWKA